jgi:8-oxo-dGTP pyrophosphatase MutT (NUDIX family)
MNIHRVARDLVATDRTPSLAAKSLRVVEDHTGNLEVALDPVGFWELPGGQVEPGESAAQAAATRTSRGASLA